MQTRTAFWFSSAVLLLVAGCGGGGGGGGIAPVDEESTMYSDSAFPAYETNATTRARGSISSAAAASSFFTISDVNHDGLDDLIGVADAILGSNHDLYIRLGSAQKIFGPYTRLASDALGFSPAVGDIDGDGQLDIVFAKVDAVMAVLGVGNGTFGSPISLSAANLHIDVPGLSNVGHQGVKVFLSDVDGDGDRDVVFCDTSPARIVALRNDGHGSFSRVETDVSEDSGSVLAPPTDFNGDHLPDVFCVLRTGTVARYALALNAGGGTFGAPQYGFVAPGGTTDSDFFADGFANIADLNNDGEADIVAVAPTFHESYLGNGDGTFSAVQAVALGDAHVVLSRVMDVYGDAYPDLVYAGGRVPAAVLVGHGDGTFGPDYFSVFWNGWAYECAAGDFNRDGIRDLYLDALVLGVDPGGYIIDKVSNAPGGAQDLAALKLNNDPFVDLVALQEDGVVTLRSVGDGTFLTFAGRTSEPRGGALGLEPNLVRIADFNGDGRDDVLCVSDLSGSSEAAYVAINNGDGTMGVHDIIAPLATAFSDPADLDSDGYPDLLISSDDGLGYVLPQFNNGDGTFTQYDFPPVKPSMKPITGDIDGDGIPNVLAYDATANSLRTFEALPNRSFVEGFALPYERAMAAYDLDGDLIDDFVSFNAMATALDVYYGRSDGGLDAGPGFEISLYAGPLTSVTIEYLNTNDRPYILINQPISGPYLFTPYQLTVLRPMGARSFEMLPDVVHPGSITDNTWHIADLTKDGKPDLLFNSDENSPFGQVEILPGRGDGTFDEPLLFAREASFRTVLADFDNDGDIDLAGISIGGVATTKINTIGE